MDTTLWREVNEKVNEQVNKEVIYEYKTENDCKKEKKIKVTFVTPKQNEVVILINPYRKTKELVNYFFNVIFKTTY